MKFGSFFLALAYSTLSFGVVDKAPKCAKYFSTHQTNGHYQPMQDGLVQDPITGLTWYRCGAGQDWADAQCQATPILLSYEAAQDWTSTLVLAGFNDWRVPTIKEMSSLVETECKSPSINTRVFSGIEPEVYWSSESNFWIRRMAWSLYFYRGQYFSNQAKASAFRFMLVRG